MATQYKAFYTNPENGEPFEVVECFRMVQMRHNTGFEGSAQLVCEHLQTVDIPLNNAVELIRQWNLQSNGRIIYTLIK